MDNGELSGTPLPIWWRELWDRLSPAERATVRLLARLEQHTLLQKLGDALADATHVSHELSDKSTVTLKLEIAAPTIGEPMTAIKAKIEKRLPGPKTLGAFAFFQDGAFLEEDPRQTRLPEGRTVELRETIRGAIHDVTDRIRKVETE